MTNIIMHGYNGRLGSAICKLAESLDEYQITAGIDLSNLPHSYTFPTYQNINDCDMPADAIIDCSTATAVPFVVAYAIKTRTPLVVCTTALTEETIELLHEASQTIPVFRSANMSLGINLMVDLLKKAVSVLKDAHFDIEIIEKHHNQKIDAPSGTALMLADVINNTLDEPYTYVYDRSKEREKRTKKEIGIHAVRGGTIVGEHSVLFAGTGEVIEIKHSALSKDVFAVGALKAAAYVATKANGMYSMEDLMQ